MPTAAGSTPLALIARRAADGGPPCVPPRGRQGAATASFGFEWTLLRLGPARPRGARLVDASGRLGIELEVVDVPSRDVRDLYEAPLALVRPDQVVAWRGVDDVHAEAVAAVALGHSVDHDPSM
jgi:hypothetical protein